MRVLVTGATGFVGRHLVPALVEAGHEVRCLHRPPSDTRSLEPLDVELAVGDVRMPASLARAAEGQDAVVHLVAILRETDATFAEINVVGVLHLAQVCREVGVDRVVHLGALGTSERDPTGYGRSKARGERIWRESDLPYVILRPSLILGPGAFLAERMADLIRRYRRVPVVGSGRSVVQPLCVEDAVAAIAAALTADPRRTHDLVGPDRWTWNELVRRAAEARGAEPALRHVPAPLVRLVARVSTRVRRDPLVTPDEVHYLQQDLTGSARGFRELTGRAPRPPGPCLEAALRRAT